jgi:cobalt/nickel transport system permease protein
MHIPDGFIDQKTAGSLGVAAALVISYALNRVRQAVTSSAMVKAVAAVGNSVKSIGANTKKVLSGYGQEYLAKIGMVASLIFSAQMFNFPISAGTSGHLLGGVLAAVLLGPWGGSLAIASVLIIQAFFYADGGIAALGANIVNMAVLGCIVPYYFYAFLKKTKINVKIIIFATAWVSVILASTMCALELAFSGTYTLRETLTAMLRVHAIIGLCEALLTVGLLGLVGKIMNWEIR